MQKNVCLGKAFVEISIIIVKIRLYLTWILFQDFFSQVKWYWILTCVFWGWCLGFPLKAMALWEDE
jgi:hypothetical protein